ncbi:CYTH domain-containing protein [endosymbiont of Ridgeia piscesae]|jgi:adenylate cyclase|uniref:Adenylate cyclase n=1 Tax=endosymbiont of Ridgeia piscesae TaxID=54398 RepID=A0A0T5Z9H5_9GAMM|nr:CYTH domain-containing protein [endosymbiont of Ridgeia piscesae]KRT56191.1 adenylate cyclase [endosymbiont of Ridgeia piscesae]KRT59530.1 adenylate cyclase [endosymbiont of Ridgeia piscesae]
MGLEIERKFLVKNDKWKSDVVSEQAIKQGYIANLPNASVRVRLKGEKALLTLKGAAKGISRSEFEYSIPRSEGEAMLVELVDGPVIDKIRYRVRCGAHIWDLDLFHGDNAGLVMAEIELQQENESFQMPEWAGEEVSDDPRYYNASLVKHPYKSW